MPENPIPFLRKTAIAEAVSYLVLIFAAMPLKHFAGLPQGVRVVGWVHGILFVVYCWALFQCWTTAKWPLKRAILLFISSLVPFMPFALDRRLREWENEFPPQQVV